MNSEEIRFSEVVRKTKETDISMMLKLEGKGDNEIDTGIGFFDHMLDGFARHGFFDINVKCVGDLSVDTHHTIEDVGITLGLAIKKAVGDKKGIRRYGSSILPMDETLMLCAVDLSGRAYLNFDASFATERVGYFETQMVREFFQAVANNAQMNIHIKQLDGINDHHKIEAIFKAFGRALDEAVSFDSRIDEALTTKGSL